MDQCRPHWRSAGSAPAAIGGADADLLSWGTHWIDMFQFLVGDPVAETVFARIDTSQATRRYGHPVDDRALFVVQFRGGARCYLEGGPDLTGRWTEGRRHQGPDPSRRQAERLARRGTRIEELPDGSTDFVDSFLLAMADLIESVEQNRDPVLAGRIAMRTTEIIMAAYELSAAPRTGSPAAQRRYPSAAQVARIPRRSVKCN